MSDPTETPDPPDVGQRAGRRFPDVPEVRFTLSDAVALGLALLWIAAVVFQVTTAQTPVLTGPMPFLMMLLAMFLPLALIWAALATARTMSALRKEAGRLQIAVDAMRHAYVIGQQTGVAVKPGMERKIDDLTAAQRRTDAMLAAIASRVDGWTPRAAADVPQVVPLDAPEQPTLALDTMAEDATPPLSVPDFVRALHFPESPDDKAGFRALRLALAHRQTSRLIRAAQDVLTLLSQEGVYMDDLTPERCRPELWRRFAAGERGRGIAALGGVRDRSSLALTSARMREDPVFRDAAHHFLRSFDKTFASFEKDASDAELADLADTRTARAFMLFGRVTGTFD